MLTLEETQIIVGVIIISTFIWIATRLIGLPLWVPVLALVVPRIYSTIAYYINDFFRKETEFGHLEASADMD